MSGRPSIFAVLVTIDRRLVRVTQTSGRGHHGLEHGIKIERRAADDLQNLAGRGLIFQRFLKIIGARPQLSQKSRVFHGDHGLRGKVFQQGDLLAGEGTHFLAVDVDHAQQGVVLPQGHGQRGARAAEIDDRPAVGFAPLIGFVRFHIEAMNDPLSGAQPCRRCARSVIRRVPGPVGGQGCGDGPIGGGMEALAIKGRQESEIGLAQPHGLFQHRIEHRRQIAGVGVDDLQHLGCRGLLFQRLLRFSDQPRVLHRDHRLGGEVLQQGLLFFGKGAHLLAIETEQTNRSLVLDQRHMHHCARATQIGDGERGGISVLVSGAFSDIQSMGRPSGFQSHCRAGTLHRGRGIPRDIIGIGRRNAAGREELDIFSVKTAQYTERGVAQPHPLFQHRIKHRSQIAGRGVDDLKNLGRRGLLFQRLMLFREQPRVLHRDHRLGGEVAQQGDLGTGKRTNLPAESVQDAEQRAVLP